MRWTTVVTTGLTVVILATGQHQRPAPVAAPADPQTTTGAPQTQAPPARRVVHVQGTAPGLPIRRAVADWQSGLTWTSVAYAPCDPAATCVTVAVRKHRGPQAVYAWTCLPSTPDPLDCPPVHGSDRWIFVNPDTTRRFGPHEYAALACHELGHALRGNGDHDRPDSGSCMALAVTADASTMPNAADYLAADCAEQPAAVTAGRCPTHDDD
jgi:hypothetical protein